MVQTRMVQVAIRELIQQMLSWMVIGVQLILVAGRVLLLPVSLRKVHPREGPSQAWDRERG